MDLIEKIHALGTRAKKIVEMIKTEEATKQALVIPFIKTLDYDVYNPSEVIPEYTVDHGIKKGEKVDYAIIKDNKSIILIECKHCKTKLNNTHASQLFRYFSVTEVRVAILTNGVVYRFFTDLDKLNQMDSKPFLEINLLNLQESLLPELHKFTKSNFNLDELISTATELKYTKEIRQILIQQRTEPHKDFVRFFASRVFPGRLKENIINQFSDLTKKAFNQLIANEINKRFNLIIDKTDEPIKQQSNEQSPKQKDKPHIVTTDEELEGFRIIKDIIKDVITPERVFIRKNSSYLSVILDDSNRRPICRLYLHRNPKRIEIMDKKSDGLETIQDIEDIRNYTARIIAIVARIDKLMKMVKDKINNSNNTAA